MGKIVKKSVLLHDIRRMIEETRSSVATVVNTGLTMLYWQIGKRINKEILKDERAEYGAGILPTLSAKLVLEYGNGFSEKNLRRMLQFAEVFPEERIVVSLIRQLSWTHIIALIPLKEPLQRDFYAEMGKLDRWAEDVKSSMEIELKELDKEIKCRKTEAKKILNLEEKITAHRQIKEMEKKRNTMRLNLYQTQDDVDNRKEQLIGDVETRLKQKIEQTELFTIRWKVI